MGQYKKPIIKEISKDIKETCYKGIRIILGNRKRSIIDKMISIKKNNKNYYNPHSTL